MENINGKVKGGKGGKKQKPFKCLIGPIYIYIVFFCLLCFQKNYYFIQVSNLKKKFHIWNVLLKQI